MSNNSLLDLTGSQCLGCMRHVQYVPDQAQYILSDCGHGWYCASCISTPPATCDVCGDMVEGTLRIFLNRKNISSFFCYSIILYIDIFFLYIYIILYFYVLFIYLNNFLICLVIYFILKC